MPDLDLSKIDLGGFGLNEDDQQQTQLNSNMTEAVKVNPDQHAQTTKLSKESGVPEFAVQSNPEQIQQKLKLDKINLEGMTQRAPKTSKFLTTDVNNSVIAQEDVISNLLEGIEKTFDGMGRSIGIGFDIQGRGLTTAAIESTSDRIQDLIPATAMPMGMESFAADMSRDLAADFGIETDEQLATAKEETSDRLIGEIQTLQKERQSLTPEDMNIVQEGVRAGVESLANMAPGLALTVLSGGRTAPLLVTIGAQTFAGSYGEGRAEGLTVEEARWFATIDAAIEVGTELLPTKTIETILTGKSKGLTKSALKFAVQEMGTEQLATALQTVNSYMFGLDKELENAETAEDMINIQLRRQAVTAIATVVAGGAQIGAATAVNKTINKLTQTEQEQATQGDIEQRNIDKLSADSVKSKLRERDVESFKQFIREADGENNTHVFIDGVQTSLFLQSKTREEIDADPALKALANAARESRATGADVAVPVDEFMGDIAGTEAATELREHMTMSDETVSPFRQEQHEVETKAYVETLMGEAQENASQYVEAQEIYTTVRDQLIDTGAVNAANASIMAQVVPAWATAQAARSGKTVQQVYTDAGLTIEGPQTGELSRLEGEQVLTQDAVDDANLVVTHNLSSENILAAADLGGLAAPSIATIRTDVSDFDAFGEVSLLADPSLLESDKARNFDADIYSPRQPRPTYDIDQKKFNELDAQMGDARDLNLSKPDINSLADGTGADNLQRSTAVQYLWLQEQGKAPKLKNKKIDATVKKAAKLDKIDARDPKFQKVAKEHYTKMLKAVEAADPGRVERYSGFWFLENGEVIPGKLFDFESEVRRFKQQGATDTHQLRSDIDKKMRVQKTRDEYDQWVTDKFNDMVNGKKLFKGFSPSGNKKYVDYNMQSVVKEMTQKLQAGEASFYGVGTVRSAFANEMKTIKQVQARRDEIVSEAEMTEVKQESADVFEEVLEKLKPFYKFDADSWGYADDAGTAITEGRKGLNEAFNVTPEVREIVDDFTEYLSALPSSYFETKIQRAVGFEEFNTAVVPKGMNKNALQVLKDAGLKIKTYDSSGKGKTRQQVISEQKKLLFQKKPDTGVARGYYDPENSIIRLTESADLSTFLHEFAHFMYEMEASGNTDMNESINNWYKRNAEDVAAEANKYLGNEFDALKQSQVESTDQRKERAREQGFDVDTTLYHGTPRDVKEFRVDKIGSTSDEGYHGAGFYFSENKAYASSYAGKYRGTPNVIPVYLKSEKPFVRASSATHGIDWRNAAKEQYAEIGIDVDTSASERTRLLQEAGYDSLIIHELDEDGDKRIFEQVMFDPKNIRSVNAQFKDAESADLLAQSQQPPDGIQGSITEADVVNFLDTGSSGNTDKDAAVRRAVHEQFARGFETYLMEGKAPSVELRNAFRTFARWLARIYQALRGDLNVNLDNEMRQVFDRLLATEEQIAAAESRARVEPMFTDAAMAGMTEEEFSNYQQRQEKVKDVQTETLRDKLIQQMIRINMKWWKEESADLVDEEMDRLSKERVYATMNTLKHVAPTGDIELKIETSKQEIIEAEKQIKKLKKDNDTIGKFIAKKGGLNRESMEAEGVDPAEFKKRGGVFGKPLFPKTGGLTADGVAELLHEEGIITDFDANEALDVINDMLFEDTRFVDSQVEGEIDSLENAISQNEQQLQESETDLQTVNIKLDHATVKEMTGEERTDKLGRKSVRVSDKFRGMTAKGQKGVHPDEAAAYFGYSSGAEMLNDILAAPPLKETAESNAQDIMFTRHGDIFTDGTIEQQADEAVQNEERGKLILHELKILARGTSQRSLDRQTMKSIAAERIGNLSFREIHPGKYRKAEIRAAQEAARMLAEGNKEGAAQAKARQALNYYLGMEATTAKNDTVKIVDRMNRYNKKKVREEIQKAEGGYWEQIVKVLERFEFRKSATLGSVDQVNQDINTWAAERMDTHGDGLVLANVVLNESYVTHWKNVAYSDLQGINDSVKNIEHVARYSNKLTRMGEEIEYNKLVEKLVTTAAETGTGRFKKSASVADDLTWIERKGRWAMGQMTKIPYMMSWMDGMDRVGTWFTTFSQPMTDAYNAELEMFEEVGKPVTDMIKNRSKEDEKRHNTTFFIPEIKGTAGGTHTGNLKGHEIIAVALNTGNEGNLKKLLLGEGWAKEDGNDINLQNAQLQAVLKHMTKSDWQMVQKIWDQIDILYPKLAEVHRRTTGLVPPKVEATPVETEHGTFKGGYYPVKYDPTRDNKAAEFEERKEAEVGSMFASNASIQASVNTGSTNERTGYFAPIHLTLNVVPNHIQETIHYITHHDAVREVNRLLRDPRVKDAVTEKLGPEEFAQLKPWLNDIAKDGRNAPNKSIVDAMFNRLRLGTTLGVMGFKASTGIIQISGLSNTIAEVGMKPVMQSMRTILGSVDSMRSAWEFATEKSKVLKHRTKTMDRELMNAMQQLESKRGVFAAIQEASMKHIALIQTYMVDLPSWHAAYIKELGESGDEKKAFQYADWVIENVQGSGVTKDMAGLMRNQTKTHTIFTMFMTFFSALWNLQRDLVKGAQSGKYSTTTVAAKAMFLFTIPVLFEMMMRGEFAKEDQEPEELLQETLTKVALPDCINTFCT